MSFGLYAAGYAIVIIEPDLGRPSDARTRSVDCRRSCRTRGLRDFVGSQSNTLEGPVIGHQRSRTRSGSLRAAR